MAFVRRGWLAALLLVWLAGCRVGPKNFRGLASPAPIVRARAVGLGNNLPEQTVIPALIGRLDDPDPVVRLTAHESLRERTGKDFGFIPWADPPARTSAVARWRSWWRGRQDGLANSRPLP